MFVTGVKSSNNVRDRSDGKWLATASIVGAIVASSCCIAPLLFVSVGISGAWIGNLTALEPYKIYFLGNRRDAWVPRLWVLAGVPDAESLR